MPTNGRFFSLFFAGSGVCVAFLIQKISKYKFFKYVKVLIVTVCSVSLVYTALFNVKKQFTTVHALTAFSKKVIEFDTDYLMESFRHPSSVAFMWLSYVKNRTAYYDNWYTDAIVINRFSTIASGKRVLFIGETESWIFPFLFTRPDLRITFAQPVRIYLEGKIYNINSYNDYLFLKGQFDYLLCCGVKLDESILQHLSEEKRIFSVPHSEFYQNPISLYEFQSTLAVHRQVDK
jgi:hypothetical protein